MSFDKGLIELLKGEPTVQAVATSGPYWSIIPKPVAVRMPCVVIHQITGVATVTLDSTVPLTERRLQFNCEAADPFAAHALAEAIKEFRKDYKGTLPDGTVVQACVLNATPFDMPYEIGGNNIVFRTVMDLTMWTED